MVWTVDQEWVRDTMLSQRPSQERAVWKWTSRTFHTLFAQHLECMDWLFSVWAKCDMSSESVFVSTWDLACFLSSFMRTEPRGSLCFLCPHRTTGEACAKKAFSLRVSWRRGLFWLPSLPAPGQPVSISAWIPPVGLVPQNDREHQQ